VENNSASPTSRASQTDYAPNAFAPGYTILALAGLVPLGLAVIFIAVIAFVLAHHGDLNSVRTQAVPFAINVQLLLDLLVVVYLAWVLPIVAKTPLRGLGFRTPTAREVGIALAGAAAMVIVVNGLGSLIDAALHTKHQQDAVRMLLSTRDRNVKIELAVLAVLIAPVAEEMTFRVFIFNAVRKYRGFWQAAIASGVLFGLAHLDLYALVPLVFGGIILCWVYSRTGNAWASMITHGLFNGFSVVVLFFLPQLAK
jgi:hypothetical protein